MTTQMVRNYVNCKSPFLLTTLAMFGAVCTMAPLAAAPPQDPGAYFPVYPLKVSSNRRYLVDQHNTPFLITGEVPQSLVGMVSRERTNSRRPGTTTTGRVIGCYCWMLQKIARTGSTESPVLGPCGFSWRAH